MSEGITKKRRLNKVVREFNVGLKSIIEFLEKKGIKIENNPNTIISDEIYEILLKEFQSEKAEKEKARQIGIDISSHETVSVDTTSKYKEKFIDKDIEKEEIKRLINGQNK